MSEHLSITGTVEHWHSPQQIFAYCHRCKKENTKLTIELNQCFCGFSVTARCPKCKRAIWTSHNECLEEDDIIYWHKKKDKNCVICGKPTNEKDCVSYGGPANKKKMSYWCSKKCYKINEKKEIEKSKKKEKKK